MHFTADSSLLLSTNKAGIRIKCYSPTPSPTKKAIAPAGDLSDSSSFRPMCTSSPSAPRTLRITAGFDGDSFVRSHNEFVPTSGSWLGCHPTTSTKRNPVKPGAVDYYPTATFVPETSHGMFRLYHMLHCWNLISIFCKCPACQHIFRRFPAQALYPLQSTPNPLGQQKLLSQTQMTCRRGRRHH